MIRVTFFSINQRFIKYAIGATMLVAPISAIICLKLHAEFLGLISLYIGTTLIIVFVGGYLVLDARHGRRQFEQQLVSRCKDLAVDIQCSQSLNQACALSELPITTFSMRATNLHHVLILLNTMRPELIVELGSGLSTIVVGEWLASMGKGRLLSFEHDNSWADMCRNELHKRKLDKYVEVKYAPLVQRAAQGEMVQWYSLDEHVQSISEIGILIIDGPPSRLGQFARYPALDVFYSKLNRNGVVFLDDGARDSERRIVSLWREKFPDLETTYYKSLTGAWVLRRRKPNRRT